jgi:hypothetical protein
MQAGSDQNPRFPTFILLLPALQKTWETEVRRREGFIQGPMENRGHFSISDLCLLGKTTRVMVGKPPLGRVHTTQDADLLGQHLHFLSRQTHFLCTEERRRPYEGRRGALSKIYNTKLM